MQQPTTSFFLPLPPGEALDLAHTFRCGQIFRWRPVGDAWLGSLGGAALALQARPGGIAATTAGAEIAPEELFEFLGLNHSLTEIAAAVDTDPWMHACLGAFPGLRVLRQDPWECLISYICSSWNNIPKIERSTQMIAERWGESRRLQAGEEEVTVHSFPSPEALATATETDLRDCGLGYRAGYVAQTAREIAGGALDLGTLRQAAYPEALKALLRLPGIGRKVADCILLFSLDQTEAVPVDVWVRRVIRQHYGAELAEEWRSSAAEGAGAEAPPGNREYDAIQQLAWRRWGKWAGHAQQYLFYGKRLGVI